MRDRNGTALFWYRVSLSFLCFLSEFLFARTKFASAGSFSVERGSCRYRARRAASAWAGLAFDCLFMAAIVSLSKRASSFYKGPENLCKWLTVV
jgi:hypothetical protein